MGDGRDGELRIFEVFGTGHSIPEWAGVYAGTVIDPPLVVHVYERPAEEVVS